MLCEGLTTPTSGNTPKLPGAVHRHVGPIRPLAPNSAPAYAQNAMKQRLFLLTGTLTAVSLLLAACGGGSSADLPALATEAANLQPVT